SIPVRIPIRRYAERPGPYSVPRYVTWYCAREVASVSTTMSDRFAAMPGSQRRRSSGTRRATKTKKGTERNAAYQTSEPTPSIRSPSRALAGGRGIRGSVLAPGGPGGGALNREARKVSPDSTSETAVTIRNNRSLPTRTVEEGSVVVEGSCPGGTNELMTP